MMTIKQLRTLNKKSGGHFFDRDTMASFGDTLDSFNIAELPDKNIEIRRKNGKGRWVFAHDTGRIINSFTVR